jgi:transcriptional regulator with XRE-family HTH domain
MARPRGYRLNRPALEAVLTLRHLTMTEGADLAGMTIKTVSNLAAGRRASMTTVRRLAEGRAVPPEALFPELAGFEVRQREVAA